MEKIAVFIDEKGEIGSFTESEYVNMFMKKDNKWEIEKKLNLNIKNINGIKEIRQAFLELTEELEDCKVVVASNAFGIPYSIFYAEDFSIWELQGKIEDILDDILIKEKEHEELEKKKNEEQIAVEINEGHYLIDLIELQLSNPELSSKKAIIPFLQTRDFTKLDIKCCHVPPWIEKEINKKDILMVIKEISKHEYKVTLKREAIS